MEKEISKLQTNIWSQLDTTKTKIEGFTEKQVKRSQEARQIYCRIGEPAVENMKMIIRQNLIKNFPVTTEDINLFNRIWGLMFQRWKDDLQVLNLSKLLMIRLR